MTQRLDPMRGLRDYFHDVARVAPADDQLDEVLARTAVATQRPAWQARLPRRWTLRDLGGQLPMRYALIALVAIALTWSVGVIGGAPSAASPFAGRWVSTDHDGSTQILDVERGPSPVVQFEDLMASGCADNGDDSVDFRATGHGAVLGDRLVVGFPGGGCHTWQVPAFSATYTLDGTGEAIQDAEGVIWRRSP